MPTCRGRANARTIIALDPEFEAWLLFFCLFPQIWATFEVRPALIATGLALLALFTAARRHPARARTGS